MQQLEQTLKNALNEAAKAVFGQEIPAASLVLQPTRKDFAGSFTLVTFPLTKAFGKGPEQIGQALGEWLQANESTISGYNVVKGFLNLEIADAEWLRLFAELQSRPAGAPVPFEGPRRVVVEYSSPNTNKPLHLGHLRNNFLGYSVAQILAATGATVTKANLVNDRGIHICKSMLAYLRFGHGETPESAGIKGDHLAGKYYVLFDKENKKYEEKLEPFLRERFLPTIKEIASQQYLSDDATLELGSLMRILEIAEEHFESDLKNGEKSPKLVLAFFNNVYNKVLNTIISISDRYNVDLSKFQSILDEYKELIDNYPLVEAQKMLQQWEAGDEEVMALWHRMNGWVYDGFNETYRAIGVDFDKFYYESGTYLLGKERVEEGLAKGVFFKKPDGSVWIDLKEEGLDEKLLLRADGTSVYITQDLGTAELKYQDFGYDSSVYVIGDEQNYHMQVLQATLQKLGKPYADAIHHLSYGMVDLPSGKMKSREGTVVDADELVNEVVEAARQATLEKGKIEGLSDEEQAELFHTLGLGALKYYLLKVDPKKRMLFNPAESVRLEGDTGPFIQYSYARIAAIRRRAAEQGIAETTDFEALGELHATERDLVLELARYAGVVAEAARNYSPAVVAQYAYDVAKAYNRFYTEVSIFNEPDAQRKAFRVALSTETGKALKASLGLLGIEVPERM